MKPRWEFEVYRFGGFRRTVQTTTRSKCQFFYDHIFLFDPMWFKTPVRRVKR